MPQIAVRGMDFHDLEPGLTRHAGGGGELADDVADLPGGQRVRNGGAGNRRQRARRDRHPAAVQRPGSACRLPMAPVEDALRPAWAIWMPGTDPHWVMTAARRVSSA